MASKKISEFSVSVFIHLVLSIMVIVTLVPFVTIIITAMRAETDLVRGPFSFPRDFKVVENFVEAWQVGRFGLYLNNSFYLMVVTIVGTLFVSTFAGYSFARLDYPGRNVLYYVILVSMMLPFQAVMLPMYFVLKNIKLLNSLNGVALIQITGGLGFSIMMMRSFFISMPLSMIEAARLDGCTETQILFKTILPNTFPAWSSLVVFNALWSWNNLLGPMIFLFSESKYPVPYALYAFQSSFSTRYDLLSAGMLISIVPLFVIYVIFQRKFTTNLLGGAIKG
jgi:raffinose/stachyose/melibiose transport system permease protein